MQRDNAKQSSTFKKKKTPMSEEKINELNAAEAPVEATEQTANIANEETVEQVAAAAENTSARALPTTKEGVIERLKEIVAEGQDVDRNEIELLKQTYYKLHNASILAAREAFLANGGKVEEFMPAPDPEEENFKAQMVRIREMRAQAMEELEKEKQAGLERKLAIIERIKEMSATPDEADKNYDEFKNLQAEWKEIKQVPAERATELWKNYQLYVEQFYDQLRLNHEFRAYDFKKNLEIKTALCEAAEKLAEVEDPVSAFHQLQKLHQEFRETGPVAKELREEIWKRFKDASTVVNKRHQEHFEELKNREEENLAKKTTLCEKIEEINTQFETLKNAADWEGKTKEVIALQAEWKTIGFTPKKMNAKIFERFRSACDAFFTAKTNYYKATRETLQANLAQKNALCEQA